MKNKRKSKYNSHKEYVREFTDNTSLHGFKYLGEKHQPLIDKIWWGIMIILSIIGCGYLIKSLLTKWNESPVIVSFAEAFTPIWKIPFPSITICSDIKSRQSYYNYTDICKRKNLTKQEIFELNSVSTVCEYNCQHRLDDFSNESTIDTILEIAPQMDEMLWICKWKDIDDCYDIFTPILTEQGLCYTANMLDIDDIYRDDVLQGSYNFSKHGRVNDGWTSDEGYHKDASFNTYPIRGSGTGVKSALEIALRKYSYDTDYTCSGPTNGFKITIHPPNILPRVSHQFSWIPLNIDSSIAIKPRMMTTSSILKDYSPHRRKCYFSNEKHLRFFKHYSQQNCEFECLTNFTMAYCGCVAYAMPRNASMPICSVGRLRCLKKSSEDFSIHDIEMKIMKNSFLPEELIRQIKGEQIVKECNCLPACTSISYDVEISQSTLHWKEFFKARNVIVNTSDVEVASIEIYFKESDFITITRSELYGLIDFLANCGGLLGLCLGFSILSLIEIVYFATLRLFWYHKMKKNSTEKSIDE